MSEKMKTDISRLHEIRAVKIENRKRSSENPYAAIERTSSHYNGTFQDIHPKVDQTRRGGRQDGQTPEASEAQKSVFPSFAGLL